MTGMNGMSAVTDDPGEWQARLAEATGRLLGTAAGLTGSQAREPSLLPGWSRGHVLSHLARNADGLRNLLVWARTGVVTPQYPSLQARDDAIQAGAGRPAAELLADLRESAAAFQAEAASMPERAWRVSVHGVRGGGHPAWYTLARRLSEVEIHHVDLGVGYQASDWPGWFVAERLESISAEFAERADVPAAQLTDTGSGSASASAGPSSAAGSGPAPASGAGSGSGSAAADSVAVADYRIGTAASRAAEPGVRISGPGWLLLAWLTGRSTGAGLTADPPGPLPGLPPW
jgi:maleylpyruvate isomerase